MTDEVRRLERIALEARNHVPDYRGPKYVPEPINLSYPAEGWSIPTKSDESISAEEQRVITAEAGAIRAIVAASSPVTIGDGPLAEDQIVALLCGGKTKDG